MRFTGRLPRTDPGHTGQGPGIAHAVGLGSSPSEEANPRRISVIAPQLSHLRISARVLGVTLTVVT